MDINLQASHHQVCMKLHSQGTGLVDLHHIIGTVTKEIMQTYLTTIMKLNGTQ